MNLRWKIQLHCAGHEAAKPQTYSMAYGTETSSVAINWNYGKVGAHAFFYQNLIEKINNKWVYI